MKKVNRFVSFVKSQAEFHDLRAKNLQHDERRGEFHSGIANTFRDLEKYLDESELSPPQTIVATKSGTRITRAEIADLPEELIKELSISDSDRLEFLIAELIEECGGSAALDRILVELYKETGDVFKRHNLNARLYRMVKKKIIHHVPGKKGMYSIYEPSSTNPSDENLSPEADKND